MIRLSVHWIAAQSCEFSDDTAPVAMAQAMADHLEKDGFFGEQLIDRLGAVRLTRDQPIVVGLLNRIEAPLLAEDRSGRRHAIGPGPVSIDGRGAAACSGTRTVKIVIGLDGRPLRATARKDPGTVQPQCAACRRRI